MRKEILTCDRCKRVTHGIFLVDFGNNYPEIERNSQKKRIQRDLCADCWKIVVRFSEDLHETFWRDELPT